MADREEIKRLLEEANVAGESYLANGENHAAKAQLGDIAAKLAMATREPAQELIKLQYRPYQNAVIRTCIAIGVFRAIPGDGSSTSVGGIAASCGCDEDLLRRFVRVLPPIGVLQIDDKGRYRHTPLSRLFANQAQAAFFEHIFGEMTTFLKFPEYFRATGYRTKKDDSPYKNAWQYANETKQPYFTWLQTQPEKLATFNLAMPSFSEQHNTIASIYPFDDVLKAAPKLSPEGVGILDVGGGNGSVLQSILQAKSALPGRMVVQDLKEMLITVDVSDPRIEFVEHDFFGPQTIKGARIYFFSHIFHDWSDDDCRRILKPTVEAMDRENSRLVISDLVLDDAQPTELETLMDLLMMTAGGGERSEQQWKGLLASVGLDIVKIKKEKQGSVIEAMIG